MNDSGLTWITLRVSLLVPCNDSGKDFGRRDLGNSWRCVLVCLWVMECADARSSIMAVACLRVLVRGGEIGVKVRCRLQFQPVDATLLLIAQFSVCCIDRLKPQPIADSSDRAFQ